MAGRTITILGMGLTGQAERFAPNLLRGTEVWGMNDGMQAYPNVQFSRWFEIHDAAYIEQWSNIKKFGGFVGYCNTINRLGAPCYTLDKLPMIENQLRYPQEDIAEFFRMFHVDGTPSRMLALACYEHEALGMTVNKIQSFGVDMRDPQHAPQRPAWATWLTVAHCLGIEIGGSAWDFAGGPESDTGISRDRRYINGYISRLSTRDNGQGDIVIATHFDSDSNVTDIAGQCSEFGLKDCYRILQDGERIYTPSAILDTIEAALEAHDKPVLWIPPTHTLKNAPTLPSGTGWGVGICGNSPLIAVNRGNGGKQAIAKLRALANEGTQIAGILGAYGALYQNNPAIRAAMIADNVAGCIEEKQRKKDTAQT